MPTKIVTDFLESGAGRPFRSMGNDAPDILEAFLQAAERPAEQLDMAAIDRALLSVIPRLKKVRLADTPDLLSAFMTFAGTQGLKDAADLAHRAADRGRQLAQDDEQQRQPVRVESPAAGRNDPCPCGSGKKYKKCCGT